MVQALQPAAATRAVLRKDLKIAAGQVGTPLATPHLQATHSPRLAAVADLPVTASHAACWALSDKTARTPAPQCMLGAFDLWSTCFTPAVPTGPTHVLASTSWRMRSAVRAVPRAAAGLDLPGESS